MTLIVSASYRDYAVQVSDRLTTRAGTPYDPEFSKTVLAYFWVSSPVGGDAAG